MIDTENLHFVSNFFNEERAHIAKCCEHIGLEVFFDDCARVGYNEKVEDCFSMYIKNEDVGTEKHELFYDIYIKLADVYKDMLLKEGKITEEFAKNHFCYLGIEKIYDFSTPQAGEILPEDHRNRATRGTDGWMPDIVPVDDNC